VALALTNRGGASVHTDEEELSEQQFDEMLAVEEGREILQQGTIAKKAKLRAEGHLRVACQMDTHTKKRSGQARPPRTDKEHCDRLGRSLVTTSWHALITSCTQRSRSTYDFALKREWQREYDMRRREPNLWPHPSPDEKWIKRAVGKYRLQRPPLLRATQNALPMVLSQKDETGVSLYCITYKWSFMCVFSFIHTMYKIHVLSVEHDSTM